MMQDKIDLQVAKDDLRYLQLLSNQFRNSVEVSTEIINLQVILSLPEGTEHFLTDVHGEHEASDHVLKNTFGSMMYKIREVFAGQMMELQTRELAALIYYPQAKLEQPREVDEIDEEWYKVTLNHLIKVCRKVGEKCTHSKVRKAFPPQYSYIIQELLHEDGVNPNKSAYISSITSTIISMGRAEGFICAISATIKRLVIDRLHIVGDIYDCGPGAQYITGTFLDYHNVDIQWGNYDMLWTGVVTGNDACTVCIIYIALRYTNLDTIEDGYGINLIPFSRLVSEVYVGDPCTYFKSKLGDSDASYDEKGIYLISQMYKAVSIIQFRLEYQLITRHPEWQMQERDLLHKIGFEAGTVDLSYTNPNEDYGVHKMLDMNLPTIDPKDPCRLTPQEEEVTDRLRHSFATSERLHTHIDAFYRLGGMYLVCNGNLLYHTSTPLDASGQLKAVSVLDSQPLRGHALLDEIDRVVHLAHPSRHNHPKHEAAVDHIFYLWCDPDPPLFDKSVMTTFERYFVADKKTHTETKGYYFKYRQDRETIEMILREFGLEGEDCHVINGYVLVKVAKGERPIAAGSKLMIIDGGFSRVYQSSTGIAGYTLIHNSQGMQLIQHEPFTTMRRAVELIEDIKSVTVTSERTTHRMLMADIDVGAELQQQVNDPEKLLKAFNVGLIKERKSPPQINAK